MTPSLLDLKLVGLLALAAAVRHVVPARWLLAYGALASGALIGVASPETLLLIGGTAVLLYLLALLIRRAKARPDGATAARTVLAVGVAAVVLLWLLFKANRQFALPFLGGSPLGVHLAAVFGFSYFLFKAINFLNIHRLTDLPEDGPLRVLYYALFPSTLTSGPIQKYADFCAEVAARRRLDLPTAATAVFRITQGYFYKVCVAAALDLASNTLLAVPEPRAWQVVALVASMYVFFFFDFAGYSHIAIGFGLLMGIRVPENFRQPFLATSMTEFWRHWHITIGDWFRDHVFIPLGGMRLGGLRAALLAGGIMVVCGLWHGLTPLFLAWGFWHGSMLFLDGVTGLRPMPPARRHGVRYWGRVLWTNARCAVGILFFLPSPDAVFPLLRGLLRW
jgi:alginate O-acetyltransferase complex protein AlgI